MFWHLRMILTYQKLLGKYEKNWELEDPPPPPPLKFLNSQKSRFCFGPPPQLAMTYLTSLGLLNAKNEEFFHHTRNFSGLGLQKILLDY